jgi:hypothetical protein
VSQRPKDRRDGIEAAAMDGFTGVTTATTAELPDAVTVTDPFHVVRLAGDALDRYRRRIQQIIHDHPGRNDDPPSTGPGAPCTPVPTCLPTSRTTACSHCPRPMSTSRPRRPGPATSR